MIIHFFHIQCFIPNASAVESNAHIGQFSKLIQNPEILNTRIIQLSSALVGVLLGGLITWLVARRYYRKALEDLRWEARAGSIPQNVLELLGAYHEWGQDIQPMQKINLSNGRLYSYKEVRRLFEKYGLGGGSCKVIGSPGFAVGTSKDFIQKVLNEHKEKQRRYSTVCLIDDSKGLLNYLKERHRLTTRVVRLWKTSPDGKCLIERLWSCIPGETIGPVKPPSTPRGDSQ